MKLTKTQLKQIIKEEVEMVLNEIEYDPERRGFFKFLGKGAAALGGAYLASKIPGGGEALAATPDKDQVGKVVGLWTEIRDKMLELADEIEKLPGDSWFASSYVRGLVKSGWNGHGWREAGKRINELINTGTMKPKTGEE